MDQLHKFQQVFPNRYIILCGDSNIYYSGREEGTGMKDITNFGNQLREKGFNLLISKVGGWWYKQINKKKINKAEISSLYFGLV